MQAKLDKFAALLRSTIEARGLSPSALATALGMALPQLSNYLNGQKSVGRKNAARLADGLMLKDKERDTFIRTALDTSQRARIERDLSNYHPGILAFLASHLRSAGIPDTVIAGFGIQVRNRAGETWARKAEAKLERAFARKLDTFKKSAGEKNTRLQFDGVVELRDGGKIVCELVTVHVPAQ